MAALILMQEDGGWSVYCDGRPMTPAVSRSAALELTIRLARETARAGGAVNLVIDEDPAGPTAFDFHMEPEPLMHFRQREPRSFREAGEAGPSLSWTARIPPRA